MEPAKRYKELVQISGFFHYGISVSNFEKVCDFFENVLNLERFSSRYVEDSYLSDLVGIDGVSAKICMFKLLDGSFIEILEWGNESSNQLKNDDYENVVSDLTSVGVQHLCLYVDNASLLFDNLKNCSQVRMISKCVTEVPIGPNKGARVFFVQVFGFLFLEIFQKPNVFDTFEAVR